MQGEHPSPTGLPDPLGGGLAGPLSGPASDQGHSESALGDSAVPGLTEGSTAWYAIQAKHTSEAQVVRHLALKAVPTYLPYVEAVRLAGGRRVARLEPLFPGYVFVRIAPPGVNPRRWHAVRWSPGVRRILGTDDTPVPVPDEVIEAIQQREKDLGFVRPGNRFTPGAHVLISNGPLAGLEAVFEAQMSRTGRARVLLGLLGQPRRVEIDELDLESA